ncbi:SRPBCC family protein [Amycolatopsis sp. NPDC049688]|uniref:SRPBCC family protein n=1 Tax=Amycolatopsis sp. NPDC049688 TaxID=3154733 RepID=UPI0034235B6F
MTELTHRTTGPGRARDCYDLVADVVAAPQHFPTHLHAEILRHDGGRDLVERWVLDQGSVRGWRFWRELDEPGLRIVFEHHEPRPPLLRMRGVWTFREQGPDTLIEVRHAFALADGDATARFAADLDRKVPLQLAHIAGLAGDLGHRRRRTVRREEAQVVPGTCESVYERIVADEADDGTSARVHLPPHGIVAKQHSGLAPDIEALTGEYRLAEDPGGVRVTIRRTATATTVAAVASVGERLEEDLRRRFAALAR